MACSKVHAASHTPGLMMTQKRGTFPSPVSALLQHLCRVPVWRGRPVGPLRTLRREHGGGYTPDASPLSPDFNLLSFCPLRNVHPATFAPSCVTPFARRVNAHATQILRLQRAFPQIWCTFLLRWCCRWAKWIAVPVSITSYYLTQIHRSFLLWANFRSFLFCSRVVASLL